MCNGKRVLLIRTFSLSKVAVGKRNCVLQPADLIASYCTTRSSLYPNRFDIPVQT